MVRQRFSGKGQRSEVPVRACGWWRAALLFCAGMGSVVMSRAAGEAAAGSGPSPTRMAGSQCMGCHKVEAEFSHPVNVAPPVSMTVPVGLPLEDGRVTCVTCHEDTAEAHVRNRVAQQPGSLLRPGYDETVVLCAGCHTGLGITRQAMHPIGVTTAHLMWKGAPVGAELLASGTQRQVALLSTEREQAEDGTRKCRSCHDGTVARDQSGGGPGGDRGHPVAKQYGGRQAHQVEMKPEGLLDKRVRLFNGQIGCESCHSPYSTLPKLLVMPNDRSKLCLSCHDL